MKKVLFLFLAIGLSLVACSKKSPTSPSLPDTTGNNTTKPGDTVAYAQWSTIAYDTNTFSLGVQVGKITDPSMMYASGIAASRAYPGMFWIENDKDGNSKQIFLVDSTGAKRAVFSVSGATNRDWTDMTIGPGPISGQSYLYIADIGDSKANHSSSFIYRFPEPAMPLGPAVLVGTTAAAEIIAYKYPDGPRDAETLLIDPVSSDLYIVDKNTRSNLYCLPYPQSTDTTILAKKLIQSMPIPDGPLRSGGISPARNEILIKSYTSIYLWKMSSTESVLDALLSTPVTIPITPEIQGEALSYTPDGSAFWTTSKFSSFNYADLDRYVRK